MLFFDEADTLLGKRLSSVTQGVDNNNLEHHLYDDLTSLFLDGKHLHINYDDGILIADAQARHETQRIIDAFERYKANKRWSE